MDVLDLLSTDNYIPLNRTLAKEIGLESAILFGALCGYQRHYGNEEFYKEQDKLVEDTCLSEYLIRQATKNLVSLELIIVNKKGLPAKHYYKVNRAKLFELLTTSGAKFDTTGDIKSDTTNNKTNNKNTNISCTENENTVIVKLSDILTKIQNLFKLNHYGSKWHNTSTAKKLLTIFTAKTKDKRLNPNQVTLAYNQYLSEMRAMDREVNYIKGSEVFLTDAVYDYVDKTKPLYEKKMLELYGEKWSKIKFVVE